mmetsp:Transcript_28446/g.79528  ORF Transcript_28446/g.79528 Transcript_28446/m.79528 type:complete len:566 (-) Transcript_28446:985-2682(-)
MPRAPRAAGCQGLPAAVEGLREGPCPGRARGGGDRPPFDVHPLVALSGLAGGIGGVHCEKPARHLSLAMHGGAFQPPPVPTERGACAGVGLAGRAEQGGAVHGHLDAARAGRRRGCPALCPALLRPRRRRQGRRNEPLTTARGGRARAPDACPVPKLASGAGGALSSAPASQGAAAAGTVDAVSIVIIHEQPPHLSGSIPISFRLGCLLLLLLLLLLPGPRVADGFPVLLGDGGAGLVRVVEVVVQLLFVVGDFFDEVRRRILLSVPPGPFVPLLPWGHLPVCPGLLLHPHLNDQGAVASDPGVGQAVQHEVILARRRRAELELHLLAPLAVSRTFLPLGLPCRTDPRLLGLREVDSLPAVRVVRGRVGQHHVPRLLPLAGVPGSEGQHALARHLGAACHLRVHGPAQGEVHGAHHRVPVQDLPLPCHLERRRHLHVGHHVQGGHHLLGLTLAHSRLLESLRYLIRGEPLQLGHRLHLALAQLAQRAVGDVGQLQQRRDGFLSGRLLPRPLGPDHGGGRAPGGGDRLGHALHHLHGRHRRGHPAVHVRPQPGQRRHLHHLLQELG